jgi:hypothetical protein
MCPAGPSLLEFILDNLNTENLPGKIRNLLYFTIGVFASAIFFFCIFRLLKTTFL